jgi:hypothetical protein
MRAKPVSQRKKCPRTLTNEELAEIHNWLRQKWKEAGPGTHRPSLAHMAMDASLPEQIYGRYAEANTSSPLIVDAASFISRMSVQQSDFGGKPVEPQNDLFRLQFLDLQKKVETNQSEFFECVAIMLKHLKKNQGAKIADIEWRKLKKFCPTGKSPRQPSKSVTVSEEAIEYAAFHVLVLRAPLTEGGWEPNPKVNTAVTRSELRKALRIFQKREGMPHPSQISESELSNCLNKTESGRFLKPLMAEQPIMRSLQKL